MNRKILKIVFVLTVLCIKMANIATGQHSHKKKLPNILFFLFDDASYEHFSANGCRWVNTPAFDRVAKEGILFQRFYTPNAKCAPSRSSILTGLYPWQLKEAANHIGRFPPEYKVFTEALKENGYKTGYTGKPWGPGIAKTADGKERELVGTGYQKRSIKPPASGISGVDYAGNFLDFLDDNKEGKPWFFWCGGWEPHRAYEYNSGINYGSKKTSMIDSVPAYLPDTDSVRTDLLDYAFEIEYFDRQIGRMINDLEKRGLLENTLVIITSDNGMPFPRSKGFSFEISNHMPMAVMWKNGIKEPGTLVSNYYSTIDIAATVLDVSHTDEKKTGMVPLSGRSLLPVFKESRKRNLGTSKGVLFFGRERNDFGRPENQGYPSRSIMKDGFLYIVNLKNDRYPAGNPETGYLDTDGSPSKTAILNLRRTGKNNWYWKEAFGLRPQEELFNVAIDKDCLVNLADNTGYNKRKLGLKKLLFDKLNAQKDPRVLGKGNVFDNYPFMTSDYWNFWERVHRKEISDPSSKTGWVNPTDYEAPSNASKH
jgi:arylsulfatase A-like enzyme